MLFNQKEGPVMAEPLNRSCLLADLQARLGAPEKDCVTLALIDVTRIGLTNHATSYQDGDRMIRWIGQQIRATKIAHRVYQLGSTRFAVLLSGGESPIVALKRIQNLVDSIHESVRQSDHIYPPHISVAAIWWGFEEFPQAGTMLSYGEQLLSLVKRTDRHHLTFLTADQLPILMRWHQPDVLAEILQALHQRDLQLYYQPIVDLTTGHPKYYEALLRLGGDHHQVSPLWILEVAERLGIMGQIDRWVIQSACLTLSKHPNLQLAVNVSGQSTTDTLLPSYILEQLDRMGVQADRLSLEITETQYIGDLKQASSWLAPLLKRGVWCSLDDFGVGWTSFSQLYQLPATTWKLDQSLVQGLTDNFDQQTIVRGIIHIATNLGKQIVAEGIENKRTADMILDLGASLGQGYLWGYPQSHLLE